MATPTTPGTGSWRNKMLRVKLETLWRKSRNSTKRHDGTSDLRILGSPNALAADIKFGRPPPVFLAFPWLTFDVSAAD